VFVAKKISKRTIITAGAILALVLLIVIRAAACSKTPDTAVASTGPYSLLASDNRERIAFLKQFGWEAESEPVEIDQVLIPQKFNKVYENYNEIQRGQGLDLEKYKGKSCKRIGYRITNYPGGGDNVRANLLIYEDKVIGGDICSTQLDGFMHGFVKPDKK
jgi:hypothetical protein